MLDNPAKPRRRFQFSLGTMFMITTVLAVMFGTWTNCILLFPTVALIGIIWLVVLIAGMIPKDENPYRSPRFLQPVELPPRQRIVSSLLLFFGIGYLCCVAVAAIVTGLYTYLFWGHPWAAATLYPAIGAVWYGRHLRRPLRVGR